jgi:Sortase domain
VLLTRIARRCCAVGLSIGLVACAPRNVHAREASEASPKGQHHIGDPVTSPQTTATTTSLEQTTASSAAQPPESVPTTGTSPRPSISQATTTLSLSTEVSPSKSARRPVRLRVPALNVNRAISLKPLTIDGDRKLASPRDPQSIGWFRAKGPLVVVGHVDSTTGPGIFFRLIQLKQGDRIEVDFDDGTSVEYVASQVSRFPKKSFPTDLVYRAPQSDLRIITCGGKFNHRTRHYVDNIIVLASPLPVGSQ